MKFREQQHRLGECFHLTKTLNVENETMYPVQNESRKFYEIFMKLFLGRKSIGCVCLQVESRSELSAILEAEKITEEIYGQNVYGRVARIEEISVSEFMDTSVCMAA